MDSRSSFCQNQQIKIQFHQAVTNFDHFSENFLPLCRNPTSCSSNKKRMHVYWNIYRLLPTLNFTSWTINCKSCFYGFRQRVYLYLFSLARPHLAPGSQRPTCSRELAMMMMMVILFHIPASSENSNIIPGGPGSHGTRSSRQIAQRQSSGKKKCDRRTYWPSVENVGHQLNTSFSSAQWAIWCDTRSLLYRYWW